MAPPLLTLQDITLTFGGTPLLDGAGFSVSQGERISLVGRNGSGKSTLLKIAAGLVEADDGERLVKTGTRIAYLAQEPDLGGFDTVLDYVESGLSEGEIDLAHRAGRLLDDLSVNSHAKPETLSGGEARRAALAHVLIAQPDILMLDEPTNHLDIKTIQWLEEELQAFRGGFILISHDRTFLNNLTKVTLWLDRGRVRRLDKGFAHFEDWADEIITREGLEQHKLDKLIAEETVWSHQGISARRTRNQGRLRRLHALRQERAAQIKKTGQVKMELDSGKSSGKLVIEATDIAKAYEGRDIIKPFSTKVLRGDKIGIIGPNGAGKTTLLRMLTGDLKPDAGSIRLGTNLEPVYLDQKRAVLNEEIRLWDFLCDAGGDQINVRGTPKHVVSYMRDFLFSEKQARSPVSALSGGERNRLLLAKALAKPSNMLILDEPTNDLDMDTLDLLQEILSDYDGTLLLVSHDRDFIDRIVTSTFVQEGDGQVQEYPGGYSDYQNQRKERIKDEKPKETAKPKVERAKKKATKLSYKDQRDLDILPGEIEQLEAEINSLQTVLSDADLFNKNPDKYQQTLSRLELAGNELAEKEERWLEIEMKREELES